MTKFYYLFNIPFEWLMRYFRVSVFQILYYKEKKTQTFVYFRRHVTSSVQLTELGISSDFASWHDKTNKMTVRQRSLRSACAPDKSDQSLRCALTVLLRTQDFFMRTAKILIKLGGCPGWSESSLGAQTLCWFCYVAAHFGIITIV